jgi:hypothetical protein
MKHLQKPILPLLILILILSAFGYREFVEDYTKTEKEILKYSYEQNQTIKNDFLYRIKDKKRRSFEEFENESICLKDDFDKKTAGLEKIYLETLKNYFVSDEKIKEFNQNSKENYSPKIPNIETLQLSTAFQNYVEKISKVDSTLAENYQNFVFEKGKTDFDADFYLQAFHYSRFEVQLAQMYYEDVKTLIDKFTLSPYNLKIEDAKIIPYIIPERKNNEFTGEYRIETVTCFPFDKQKAKLVFPENIETTFDENGFIIIPKEFRKGEQARFGVRIPMACGKDTVLSIKMGFDHRKKYFDNEK